MSVMSRTTTLLLPRKVTSARQRLSGVHGARCPLGVDKGVVRGAEATPPVGVVETGPQPATSSAATATIRIQRRALVVIQRKHAVGPIVTRCQPEWKCIVPLLHSYWYGPVINPYPPAACVPSTGQTINLCGTSMLVH